MKRIVPFVFLLLMLPGHLLAASDHDACVREEAALRTQEKERCSGFRYFFDPSSCFSTRKKLDAFNGGRCREIIDAAKEGAVPPHLPVQQALSSSSPVSPPTPGVAPVPAADKEGECGRLKEENVRLRGEIDRLRAEIDRLGKK